MCMRIKNEVGFFPPILIILMDKFSRLELTYY